MPIQQSTPGERGGVSHVHFSYQGTDAKRPWHGYVAGPCMWFDCHTPSKSQPCLLRATNGELDCPRCHEIKPWEPIGYLPVYRQSDGKPLVVIVHEYTREIVDKLEFHRRVLVKREDGVGDGVCVTHALDRMPKYHSTLADRNRPAQPMLSLLKMWRYPQLVQWLNDTDGTDYPVCITPPREKGKKKKDVTAAPPPPELPAGNMGETAMEAMDRLRLRNEEWIRQAKGERPPT